MAPPKTPNAPRGTIHGASAHNVVNFTIRAAPLPESITSFLQSNVSILRKLHREGGFSAQKKASKLPAEGGDDLQEPDDAIDGEVVRKATVKLDEFWPALEKICKEAGGQWADVADRIWAFGPQHVGPNLLIDAIGSSATSSVLHHLSRNASLITVSR